MLICDKVFNLGMWRVLLLLSLLLVILIVNCVHAQYLSIIKHKEFPLSAHLKIYGKHINKLFPKLMLAKFHILANLTQCFTTQKQSAAD